jgi:quinol monooxygenase YgiN
MSEIISATPSGQATLDHHEDGAGGAFIAIAIHHAAPAYRQEFVGFMRKVLDATEGAPGLLEFKACRDANDTFLAGLSRWASAEAFQAALPTIYGLEPLRKPEWSTKPDEVITLLEL